MFSAALKHVMTGLEPFTVIPGGDENLANNVLMLKTGTQNNRFNTVFLDSSSDNRSVTPSGNVSQTSLSPYVPTGYWSGYFDGGGDYLSISDHASLDLPGDFCIEFWLNADPDTPNNGGVIGHRVAGGFSNTTDWVIRTQTVAGKVGFGYDIAGNWYDMGNLTYGQWVHYAVTRSGSTVRTFRNGTLVTTATDTSSWSSSGNLLIGENAGNGVFYKGFMSNVRIVKDSPVYTASFARPTAPLTAIAGTSLLCLQDNRFRDRSANNHTITTFGEVSVRRFSPQGVSLDSTLNGSAYFDGTGDRLSIATGVLSGVGSSGDFTIEFWIYNRSLTTTTYWPAVFTINGYNGVKIQIAPTGVGSYFPTVRLTSDVQHISSSISLTLNQWDHVALVRNAGTLRLYINGQQAGSVANTTDVSTSGNGTVSVGSMDGQGGWIDGYISDFRVVKSAVYSAAFTPPTAPLSPVTGTSLLLRSGNLDVFDSGRGYPLTLVGNAATSTTIKKYSASSLALNIGTNSDYVAVNDTMVPRFRTGDFTVEAWIYPTTVSASSPSVFFSQYTSSNGFWFRHSTTTLQCGNGDSAIATYGNVVLANVWQHVAVSRSGGFMRVFWNGVQQGPDISYSVDLQGNTSTYIGLLSPATGQYFNGYIEDMRITVGTGRYTSNFNVPSGPLAVTAGLTSPIATGGFVENPLRKTWVHTFSSTGTFTLSEARDVEYLVVGGGGGGGGYLGGGGGAGGFRTGTFTSLPAGTYTISVGAGGAGGLASSTAGGNGGNSAFHTITSNGGGGGGPAYTVGPGNGGSGGGNGVVNTNKGGSGNTPSTSPSQGNDGGGAGAENYGQGGGGGASAVGGSASGTSPGGNGGAGSSSSITGTSVTYAGGGGGSGYFSVGGSGGSGGGGNGGSGDGVAAGSRRQASDGVAGTGGGGGGGTYLNSSAQKGGAGGSGIVIVRYTV